MDQPLDAGLACLGCQPLGTLDVQGMKGLRSVFYVKTDRIHRTVRASKRVCDRSFVVNISFDRSCGSSRAKSPLARSGCLDAIRTESPRVRRRRTTRRPRNPVPPNTAMVRSFVAAMAQIRQLTVQVPSTACLLTTDDNVAYLIQMGTNIDAIRTDHLTPLQFDQQ